MIDRPGMAAGTPSAGEDRIDPTTVPQRVLYTGASIDGCPNHLAVVNGQKYVSYDVAAWSDLWFYANPIFVEVR